MKIKDIKIGKFYTSKLKTFADKKFRVLSKNDNELTVEMFKMKWIKIYFGEEVVWVSINIFSKSVESLGLIKEII